jgi:hypothetical protein
MKSVFSEQAVAQMIKQLHAEYKKYHARVIEYAKKGKDVDDVPAPKYLITEGLKGHIDDFLIVWGELEEIAEEQEKVWGKKATEIHDLLIQKMLENVIEKNAEAYSRLFIPNPAASEPAETEGEEENE